MLSDGLVRVAQKLWRTSARTPDVGAAYSVMDGFLPDAGLGACQPAAATGGTVCLS